LLFIIRTEAVAAAREKNQSEANVEDYTNGEAVVGMHTVCRLALITNPDGEQVRVCGV